MSKAVQEFTEQLCHLVNKAHKDGMTPLEIFNCLSGTIAATAFKLGAEDEDVFSLFTGFAYRFRPKSQNTGMVGLNQSKSEQHAENRV